MKKTMTLVEALAWTQKRYQELGLTPLVVLTRVVALKSARGERVAESLKKMIIAQPETWAGLNGLLEENTAEVREFVAGDKVELITDNGRVPAGTAGEIMARQGETWLVTIPGVDRILEIPVKTARALIRSKS